MASSANPQVGQRVWLTEHDNLYEDLQRIARAADRLEEHGSSKRRKRLMSEELSGFAKKYKKHVEREVTKGALFDTIEGVLPDQKNALAKLRDEHQSMFDLVDHLKDQLSATGELDVQNWSREAPDLVDALYAHELAEERLAERALSWVAPSGIVSGAKNSPADVATKISFTVSSESPAIANSRTEWGTNAPAVDNRTTATSSSPRIP